MGYIGKGMVPISSQTTKPKRDYLDLRAARMNCTRSEFLALMIDGWLNSGAPAVSVAEAQLGIAPIPAEAMRPRSNRRP